MKAIGDEIKNVLAINPVAAAYDATLTGNTIDRLGYLSAVASFAIGSISAAISSLQISLCIQHGASSTLSDAAYATGAITTISAATCALGGNQLVEIDVDLTSLNRYIRMYAVNSVAGNDAATVPVSGVIQLGQARSKPVA